ncbi:hypothetical protein [Endozoicomonas sp. 4G]|uniref:hypothetical protein n=1 Tax=Endozoicomonas sp. 4G TaxID=2872754 RepID=UPI002078B59A|nr:hypothetical protein [Endozoicomonas sp. 4G]
MHLSSIHTQAQAIRTDTPRQEDLSPEKKRLHTDDSLHDEGKSLHHRKTRKIATLEKPEGYFTVGKQYKISLMKDYLNGNTQHFSDDDWLYLIIKMGKRAISEKNLKALQQEFSTTDEVELFSKIARLQALRYKIEDIVQYSRFDSRNRLYKIAKKDEYLFPAGSLEEIIESAKNNNPLQSCAAPELLYATASLNHGPHNPFFSELIITCYRNSRFSPPDIETGHKIEHEIKNQIPKMNTSQENLEIESMLLDKATTKKVCGGRTIQLTLPDGQVLYLKFQRKDEPWDQFTRELKMHNALHDLFSKQDFASEIPVSKGLFSIPGDKINKIFEDELEISEGRLYGYCFAASSDYVNYACQPDPSNPKKPYLRSEEGLKKAAIDIGRYARYGLTFDSLIKTQHLKIKSILDEWLGLPKWMTLGHLAAHNCGNRDFFPGAICDWVEDTERSDLSWSGLRDLGDSQIFETAFHSLPPKNPLGINFFPKISNLLAFFNALMDNIIAIVVVYARGKRLNHEFHYQNPAAVEDVKKFIRDILEHFVRGYYSTHSITLQQALRLDNTTFELWLNRTSLEIIYWSAVQIYEMTGDFFISNHDHDNQNYFTHIKKNKRPDPEIMKTSRPILVDAIRDNCFGSGHNLGLGHINGFPFQALIKGLCQLSINMLEQASPTDQNFELFR